MAELRAVPVTLEDVSLNKESSDPEIASVKQLLRQLDKTAKNVRTFGASNPVAQKFSSQLYQDLAKHLESYQTLSFLIQRGELEFKGEVVYRPQAEGMTENIAFKLYADGIRELTFKAGLSQQDLSFFFDALWGEGGQEDEDEDFVTRLWKENLQTVTIVTAEEIVQASSGVQDVLSLQESGTLDAPTSSLREILDREKAKAAPQGAGKSQERARFQSGIVGYEITPDDLAALAKEIAAESNRDGTRYILDTLIAILASERSPSLLTKLFEVFDSVIDSLIGKGEWGLLENVMGLLHDSETLRSDLSDAHKQQLAGLFNGLGRPERLKLVEAYLNKTPNAKTDGLLTVFLHLRNQDVPSLCLLLANLQVPSHQILVCEVLADLARQTPEPILRGLTDRRAGYVRNLLAIMTKWNDPRHLDAIERIIRYPDPAIRKEVLRILGTLRPKGNGARFVGMLSDPEDSVRHAALRLLTTGNYTAPYAVWEPILTADDFYDRSSTERRLIFQALCFTAKEEADPFWRKLLTEWSWTNRKKKEESAVLAAEALGKAATPSALAALEFGQQKGNAAVREACRTALRVASKQRTGSEAKSA
jgi:hypothetical protein